MVNDLTTPNGFLGQRRDGERHLPEVAFCQVESLLSRSNKFCQIEVKSSGYKTQVSLDEFYKKFYNTDVISQVKCTCRSRPLLLANQHIDDGF